MCTPEYLACLGYLRKKKKKKRVNLSQIVYTGIFKDSVCTIVLRIEVNIENLLIDVDVQHHSQRIGQPFPSRTVLLLFVVVKHNAMPQRV